MNDFILTFDIDWAPDHVIDHVAGILIEKKVKATWFVTHRSEAIERLRENKDLFELGIHPNMMPGSTHGKTEDEVLAHIKKIVPEAVSMRTHCLYQSSNFLVKAAKEYGVLFDASLFLPRAAYLHPHQFKWHDASLWRVPYFWEDDVEMFEEDPIWDISDPRLKIKGLKVIDFHPTHVALNTNSFETFKDLRKVRPLESWDEGFILEHTNKDKGPRDFLYDLVGELSGKGKQIKDIVKDMGQL